MVSDPQPHTYKQTNKHVKQLKMTYAHIQVYIFSGILLEYLCMIYSLKKLLIIFYWLFMQPLSSASVSLRARSVLIGQLKEASPSETYLASEAKSTNHETNNGSRISLLFLYLKCQLLKYNHTCLS